MFNVTITMANPRSGKTTSCQDLIKRNPGKSILAMSWGTDVARRYYGNRDNVRAMGILSGVNGAPFDIIILDDIIKNREEAENENFINNTIDRLDNLLCKINPRGEFFIIGSRYNEKDFLSRCVKYFETKPYINLKVIDVQRLDLSYQLTAGDISNWTSRVIITDNLC